jgi:peroxiredoxin
MTLQQRLDTIKNDFEAKEAPAVVAITRRAITDLIASGQADRALRAGDRAPSFTLSETAGRMISLSDLVKKGPLILTFYRGIWSDYCNAELQALEECAGAMRAKTASLVAISQQTRASSRKTKKLNRLSFPVLSDTGGRVTRAFGVLWTLPGDLRSVYQQLGADLPYFNGNEDWTLPMPARYVIGRDSIIVYCEVNPDYTKRPEPSDVFPCLVNLMRQYQ